MPPSLRLDTPDSHSLNLEGQRDPVIVRVMSHLVHPVPSLLAKQGVKAKAAYGWSQLPETQKGSCMPKTRSVNKYF